MAVVGSWFLVTADGWRRQMTTCRRGIMVRTCGGEISTARKEFAIPGVSRAIQAAYSKPAGDFSILTARRPISHVRTVPFGQFGRFFRAFLCHNRLAFANEPLMKPDYSILRVREEWQRRIRKHAGELPWNPYRAKPIGCLDRFHSFAFWSATCFMLA